MAKTIDIEGTDGAGKSTAFKYLIEKLRASGKRVLETREVGTPLIPVCVKLRELILDPTSNLNGISMELIFAAMRIENQKYYATVESEYDYIVSDRGWLSHLAYTDHNVNRKFTEQFYYNLVYSLTKLPDMVIYLNVDTETALQRRQKRGSGMDVIEMKGVGFQEKVRNSFLDHMDTLEKFTDTYILTVDANRDIKGVETQMDEIIHELEKLWS